MKYKRIAVCICAATLLTLTGCGDSETDTVSFGDVGQDVSVNVADTQENGNAANENADSSQTNQAQEDRKEAAEWEGVVESIGENSIVAAKIAVESSEIAVYAADSDEKVTVYFSAETTYEVKTVKNGGVNGSADTDLQQGSFSDIKEQSTINLTGSYQGDDFYATHVVIYRFV